jgi:hypothetical protein
LDVCYLAIDSLTETFWRLGMQAEGELGLREAVDERFERLGSAAR